MPADSVRTGRQALATFRPSLALMELRLPDGSAIELLGRIPAGCAIVISQVHDGASVLSALRAGAQAYLLADEPAEVLVRQIRAVQRGELAFSPQVAHFMMGMFLKQGHDDRLSRALTPQQCRILRLVTGGLTTAQIARQLMISPNTVRTHLKRLYSRLSVSSRAQAASIASKMGLAAETE